MSDDMYGGFGDEPLPQYNPSPLDTDKLLFQNQPRSIINRSGSPHLSLFESRQRTPKTLLVTSRPKKVESVTSRFQVLRTRISQSVAIQRWLAANLKSSVTLPTTDTIETCIVSAFESTEFMFFNTVDVVQSHPSKQWFSEPLWSTIHELRSQYSRGNWQTDSQLPIHALLPLPPWVVSHVLSTAGKRSSFANTLKSTHKGDVSDFVDSVWQDINNKQSDRRVPALLDLPLSWEDRVEETVKNEDFFRPDALPRPEGWPTAQQLRDAREIKVSNSLEPVKSKSTPWTFTDTPLVVTKVPKRPVRLFDISSEAISRLTDTNSRNALVAIIRLGVPSISSFFSNAEDASHALEGTFGTVEVIIPILPVTLRQILTKYEALWPQLNTLSFQFKTFDPDLDEEAKSAVPVRVGTQVVVSASGITRVNEIRDLILLLSKQPSVAIKTMKTTDSSQVIGTLGALRHAYRTAVSQGQPLPTYVMEVFRVELGDQTHVYSEGLLVDTKTWVRLLPLSALYPQGVLFGYCSLSATIELSDLGLAHADTKLENSAVSVHEMLMFKTIDLDCVTKIGHKSLACFTYHDPHQLHLPIRDSEIADIATDAVILGDLYRVGLSVERFVFQTRSSNVFMRMGHAERADKSVEAVSRRSRALRETINRVQSCIDGASNQKDPFGKAAEALVKKMINLQIMKPESRMKEATVILEECEQFFEKFSLEMKEVRSPENCIRSDMIHHGTTIRFRGVPFV